MHHCLEIQEILRVICNQLNPFDERDVFRNEFAESGAKLSLTALAIMARTCKTFSDPALDVLWESADIKDLLLCMPADVWAVRQDHDKLPCEHKLVLLRPIHTSDCERLWFYARRIKHLRAHEDNVDLSIFPTLGVDLLRHVQSLQWLRPEEDFHMFYGFLGPALTRIEFEIFFGVGGVARVAARLPALAVSHPQLKDIRISFPVVDANVSAVSTLLCALHCAEFISVPTLNYRAFCHLASLRNLKYLTLTKGFPELPGGRTDIRLFPALRSLDFLATRETAGRLLDSCTEIPLTLDTLWFGIDADTISTGTQVQDLCSRLPAAILHSSLRSLDLLFANEDIVWATAHTDYVIPNHAIRALFCFRNLTRLLIYSSVGIDLDDSTVLDLTCACPLLETLELKSVHAAPLQQRTTLQSLFYFSKNCSSLATLVIDLDATAVPDPEPDAEPISSQQALVSLDVQYSTIAGADSVARFLLLLFPNLQSLHTRRDFDTENPRFLSHFYPSEDEPDEAHAKASYTLWKEVASSISGCTLNP